jgi:hypothetical protein
MSADLPGNLDRGLLPPHEMPRKGEYNENRRWESGMREKMDVDVCGNVAIPIEMRW